ncbi:hypothetical protein FKW77_000988 [Venturia effusa]|uniref:Ketoreductase (KR) domain-containing protein n=1 Tax=Venturia effusa TaxID=50376 RepID=A0A517LGG2_9PEZI|nr:hypothetical protein FKW77_000988 [Venturia effusa]
MSAARTIVVFGSGPGIGRSVAQEFASNGFTHVILLARHHGRLHQDKTAVEKCVKDIKVDVLTVDLSDKASLQETLTKIDSLSKEIECVFYNGARVAPSTLLEFPVEEMELDSLLYKYPIPAVFSLTVTKAAQRAMVECLYQTYKDSGVHCGLISVGGEVGPGNKALNPDNIARKTWALFEQPKGTWELEVEIMEAQ